MKALFIYHIKNKVNIIIYGVHEQNPSDIFKIQNFSSIFDKYNSIFTQNFDSSYEPPKEACQGIKPLDLDNDISFQANCVKCMKYLDYLDKTYKEQHQEKDQKEGITYLYLWLYDNELHKDTYTNKNTLDLFEKLLKSFGDNCILDSNLEQLYKGYVKSKLDNNMNKLYYLYYKFYILSSDGTCKKGNCDCAQNCVDLYNTYKEVCDNDGYTHFCNELYNFAHKYNAYIIEHTNCNNKKKYLLPTRKYNISLILAPIFITLIVSSILFILYKVFKLFFF
ncbi:hypothetical protein PVMG_02541 [Plasmodium vivax Mauritania I]|uniref:Variable surface protein n=1 Tax=Plasmodium vivax Mauritania I TaxID=1035515 RepID=A0A0J9TIT6_PLAVI|nr:hypothetical protein PVMG_02541 [Plasmodium vivax Mauritania I]